MASATLLPQDVDAFLADGLVITRQAARTGREARALFVRVVQKLSKHFCDTFSRVGLDTILDDRKTYNLDCYEICLLLRGGPVRVMGGSKTIDLMKGVVPFISHEFYKVLHDLVGVFGAPSGELAPNFRVAPTIFWHDVLAQLPVDRELAARDERVQQ
jgi:hypothetical protein